ncbi:uncharacterized protein LOC118732796 [Rhagoletis pomonella]|uniref:uncharacterized protein LOC118732796 n=1 Tax=Rhagoletis pomonella TaxID=28610 RepID=UPI001786C54E|nr:uncharacterized protein LOC118732796 [Rhagoletis pomonella]
MLRQQVPPSDESPQINTDITPDCSLAITYEELVDTLKKKNNNSAGGQDRTTYKMIKSLPDNTLNNLRTALSDVFLTNQIPDSWRTVKVVPIPKKDKDLNGFRNFPPIALISVLLKCINSCLKNRIEQFLDGNEILPNTTFAYRKARSATMAVNYLVQELTINKQKGNKIIICSIDISNAYNCVPTSALTKILEECNINSNYIIWFQSFLKKRILKLGKESVIINDGLPQGSCLSPLLFNLYTKSLHDFEDDSTDIFQFADDFLIMVHDRHLQSLTQKLQLKLKTFIDKCSDLNFNINTHKTKSIYFAKTNKKQLDIKIDNLAIEQVNQIKFIGRTLNSSLTVTSHFNKLIKKAANNVKLIQMITTVKAGVTPKVAVNLYKSLVRSKIEVARSTTHNLPKTTNNKIMAFQNKSLRRCLGLTPSTPVHNIYALANEFEPKEREMLLTSRELIKLKFINVNAYNNVAFHNQLNSSYSKTYYQFKEILDNVSTQTAFTKNRELRITKKLLAKKKTELPKQQIKAEYYSLFQKYKENNFTIFATDASGGVNSMGCGVYNVSQKQHFYFSIDFKSSSAFSEMWAIAKAVDIAFEDNLKKIVIFTDSLASCQLLSQETSNNYIVANIHNTLNKAKIQCEVVWTPSHVGIEFNEIADYIAKLAVDVGAPLATKLTPEEALSQINTIIKNNWNTKYQTISQEKGKTLANFFPEIPNKPWYHNSTLEAKEIKTINRLLTGHTYDKEYLNRIKIVDTNICDTCHVLDNYTHMIFACKRYDTIRNKYNAVKNHKDCTEILKKRDCATLKELCNFIQEANLDF